MHHVRVASYSSSGKEDRTREELCGAMNLAVVQSTRSDPLLTEELSALTCGLRGADQSRQDSHKGQLHVIHAPLVALETLALSLVCLLEELFLKAVSSV